MAAKPPLCLSHFGAPRSLSATTFAICRPSCLQRARARPTPFTITSTSSEPGIRTIKSIQKKPVISRYNKIPGIPVLGASQRAALERKEHTTPLRPGALATKKGMTAIIDPTTGARHVATVLQLDRVQIVGQKTRDVHGYYAVQVGSGWRKPENIGKPMLGHLSKNGVPPKKEIAEFRVRDERGLGKVGMEISPSWWRVGDYVDIKSKTRGMGFEGGMKRWGWAGQPASHGNSKNHRTMGSSGGGQGSGSRVHPGKRMAGRMGGQFHTIQSLRVLQVDDANGIVVVSGPVSGPKSCTVRISDAKLKPWPDVPLPITAMPPPAAEAVMP